MELEALDNLRSTARSVDEIDDEHPQLTTSKETLGAALNLLDDAARDLRHYQEQVVVDPQALADIDARLQMIYELARKHRVQPEQLAEHATTLEAELAAMTSDSSDLDELMAAQEKQHQGFVREAQKLSKARHKHSKRFAKRGNTCTHWALARAL